MAGQRQAGAESPQQAAGQGRCEQQEPTWNAPAHRACRRSDSIRARVGFWPGCQGEGDRLLARQISPRGGTVRCSMISVLRADEKQSTMGTRPPDIGRASPGSHSACLALRPCH